MSSLSKPLRIAYIGSPAFSAQVLESLIRMEGQNPDLFQVVCVVTQPDRPAGRKLVLTPTPVKLIAQERNIPIHDRPLSQSITEVQELFSSLHVDLALVYAYNDLIPLSLIQSIPYGFWNIHPSLLPHYRGPSPVVFPLALGDKETGVSLIQMNEQMDAGPILASHKIDIDDQDNHMSLIYALSQKGQDLFIELVQRVKNQGLSAISLTRQDETQATYTFKLSREDGFIPQEELKKFIFEEEIHLQSLHLFQTYSKKNPTSAPIITNKHTLYNLWRALEPWPGLWTRGQTAQGVRRLKIVAMEKIDERYWVTRVQLEGKDPVDIATFLKGYPSFLN